MLVIMILTVAACEAGLALALIVMLYQRTGRLDIAAWSEIREDSLPAYQDVELDEFTATEQVWPTLTRSGVFARRRSERRSTGRSSRSGVRQIVSYELWIVSKVRLKSSNYPD